MFADPRAPPRNSAKIFSRRLSHRQVDPCACCPEHDVGAGLTGAEQVQPRVEVARVTLRRSLLRMGNRMVSSREGDFTAFYEATWPRTVACAYAMSGDFSEAEDLAQEAYSRAWPRWSSLREYDDPGAWVRHVATRLAVSRWRRARTAAGFLAHSRAPEPAAPPSEATAALVAALRQLPEAQRRAIVLHHLGELAVVEIARIEQCPEGTVKARLARGRAALAELLAPQDGDRSYA